ncbi:rhodopsin, GQ-coupled-like [Antedon mediterranea]|uniref:rhodopsin, GQ-coupled-like n=1 Tax=Antedon mediterranea TaxID=105859 RepID=UPI003AF5CE2E
MTFKFTCYYRTKKLFTPGNMLIINLAVSDLNMVITQFPAMFITSVVGKWLYGDVGCQIYAFFGSTFGVMSITTISAISLDRYYVICKPMKATRTVTKRRSMYIIAFVWIYSIAWAVPPLLGFGRYTREGYGLSCTFDYTDQSISNKCFVGMIFGTDFLLQLALIICCYVKIVSTMRHHRNEMKRISRNTKSPSKSKSEFKIAKIGMIMTALFCLTWLPYASVAFIGQFIDPSIVSPMVQTLPVVLAKTSAVLNPIVYAMSYDKFKIAFTERFLHCCCKQFENEKLMGHESRSQTLRRTYTPVIECDPANSIPLEDVPTTKPQ